MATPQHSHWQNDPAILSASKNAPPLKLGSVGTGVQRLREALVLMGAPVIAEAPAQFGPATHAQVETFQGLYGLTQDGSAGTGTIGKLDELLQIPARRKPWPVAMFDGSKEGFFQKVAGACGPVVKQNGLPVSAMLACAAVESGWGRGPIFRQTNNLFSMQKWPWVPFPATARTLWLTTVIQTSPVKTARAPFNTTVDLADAGRQWCEWILHYGAPDGPPGNVDQRAPHVANAGAIARRSRLIAMAGDPVAFAGNLYLVSFGESHAAGHRYADVLTQNKLTRFD